MELEMVIWNRCKRDYPKINRMIKTKLRRSNNSNCISHVVSCVPKKFRKSPSAASNFPKGFRHVHFQTSSMSIFWKFFESCANSNRRNNKINLCNNHVIMRA